MKKYIIRLVFMAGCISICSAQDTIRSQDYKPPITNNKLGFAGSMLSGYGISYEYTINKNVTFEVTGSIYGSGGDNSSSQRYSSNNKYLVLTLGAEIQRNIFTSHDSRFYGLVGVGYWIDNTTYSDYGSGNGETNTDKTDYTGGLGLGWEFTFGKNIIFNLEAGFVYRDFNSSGKEGIYDKNSNYSIRPFSGRNSYYIGFGGGAGIYYAF